MLHSFLENDQRRLRGLTAIYLGRRPRPKSFFEFGIFLERRTRRESKFTKCTYLLPISADFGVYQNFNGAAFKRRVPLTRSSRRQLPEIYEDFSGILSRRARVG